MAAEGVAGKKEPLAFMLQWSPRSYDWEADELHDLIDVIAKGRPARSSWSVNAFNRLIQPGSRVFMRRVVDPPLGVVGEGVVGSEAYWAPSYKKEARHRDIPYVDIDWLALTPSAPLANEDLSGDVKAMTHRYPMAIYDPDELSALDQAWTDHLAKSEEASVLPLLRDTRKVLREERTFQGKFRNLVLDTHGRQCAVCGLAEESILDAAHIVAHADGGLPTAENGRPLCANHHRAYDRQLLAWHDDEQAFDWIDPERRF